MENKLSCASIAEIENVNEQIVRNVLYKHNWKYLTKDIEFPKRNGKEKDRRVKLTPDDARDICELLMLGKTSKEIAAMYNISYQGIDKIKEHKVFKSITEQYNFPLSVGRGTRKLNRDEVIDILKMSKNGFTISQIAEKYPKVKSNSTFSNIINNITWKEIDRNSI